MEYLIIVNWKKFQHYKDRNPPWIKLHTEILCNYEFCCLQDDSKLLLMLLWILASKLDNKIPNDTVWIKEQIHIQNIDLQPLIDKGFIKQVSNDSIAVADCKQVAIPETEAEKRKSKVETEKKSVQSFDTFWEKYPRKEAKQRAVEWFRKNKPSAEDVSKMLSTIVTQSISGGRLHRRDRDSVKYIPLPCTWLNDGDWRDAPTEEDIAAETAAEKAKDAVCREKARQKKRAELGQFYREKTDAELEKFLTEDNHILNRWLIREILKDRSK